MNGVMCDIVQTSELTKGTEHVQIIQMLIFSPICNKSLPIQTFPAILNTLFL